MKITAVKFKSRDEVSRVELKRCINQVSMKKKYNPKVLFSQLTEIEQKYKTEAYSVPPEKLMAVVPEESLSSYAVILLKILREKNQACTLNDLRDAMKIEYRIVTKVKQSNSYSKELGLGSVVGTCYKCRETGYRAN